MKVYLVKNVKDGTIEKDYTKKENLINDCTKQDLMVDGNKIKPINQLDKVIYEVVEADIDIMVWAMWHPLEFLNALIKRDEERKKK